MVTRNLVFYLVSKMTLEMQEKIEESKQFRLFLIRFGVHGFSEYETFSDLYKGICLDVFMSLYPNFGK